MRGNGATDMMLKYDLNGKLLEAWGKAGTTPGSFQAIHGFGVDSTGDFYAAEAARGPDPEVHAEARDRRGKAGRLPAPARTGTRQVTSLS